MNISERILKIRKALSLKQFDFAEPLGIDRSYVAVLEKGTRQPSETLIKLISLQYGVSVTWLKSGEGEMFISPEDAIKNQIARFGKRAFIEAYKNVVEDDNLTGTSNYTDSIIDIEDPELQLMVKTLFDIWAADDERLKSWATIQFDIAFPRSIIEAKTQYESISQKRQFKQAEKGYQPFQKERINIHESKAAEKLGIYEITSDSNSELIQKKGVQDDIDLSDIMLVAHAEGRDILQPLSPELKAIVKDAIKFSRQRREEKENETTEDN